MKRLMQLFKRSSSAGPVKIYQKPGSLIITTGVVLIGAVLAVMFLVPTGERINNGGYQVVYMTTGQTYFGKLQNSGGEYLVLKDPYTAQDVAAEAGSQVQTTLLKVSQQAYGPEDTMSLKSDQVLFWQNLRSDSKVTKAIESKQ